jgi:uncharacterized protein
MTDLTVVFMFGLVGSVHCLQMCGPLVLAYSLPLERKVFLPHLGYNLGRILTYSLLGAVAGQVGHMLEALGRLSGFENIAALIAGIALILLGLAYAGFLPMTSLAPVSRITRTAGRLLTAPTFGSKVGLGLALGFLPCGFLYAALIKAMEAGNPVSGAATMLVFGLGTSLALVAAGSLSTVLTTPLKKWGRFAGAAGVLLLGSLLLYRGLMGHGILPPSMEKGGHGNHAH